MRSVNSEFTVTVAYPENQADIRELMRLGQTLIGP